LIINIVHYKSGLSKRILNSSVHTNIRAASSNKFYATNINKIKAKNPDYFMHRIAWLSVKDKQYATAPYLLYKLYMHK